MSLAASFLHEFVPSQLLISQGDAMCVEGTCQILTPPLQMKFLCYLRISAIFIFFSQSFSYKHIGSSIEISQPPLPSLGITGSHPSRGAMTWATLAQSVCLSALLATKDSMTPLKATNSMGHV